MPRKADARVRMRDVMEIASCAEREGARKGKERETDRMTDPEREPGAGRGDSTHSQGQRITPKPDTPLLKGTQSPFSHEGLSALV